MSDRQQPTEGARPPRRLRTRDLISMKERGERIAVLTAYDYLSAGILDAAGIECVLVGDSVGQVFAGEDSTLPVTLDQMIYHGRAVARAVRRALVVVDMPFLTYQTSAEDAIRNCGRVLQESGAQAVKLEGGHPGVADAIRRVVEVGIPVMGHLGLTPQSVHALGGYRVIGREMAERGRALEAADRLADAGCFALVLEMMPRELAAEITGRIPIPTIGIGAGPECDGQVLVLPDMLGLNESFRPGFLKRYGALGDAMRSAVETYVREVKEGVFPGSEHSYE